MTSNRASLVLVLLLAAAGCSEEDGRIPVVVYSPHGPEILGKFEKRFEAEHPDVDVRWFNLPSQECLTRLRAEKANPSCDVFWGATASIHRQAAAEGLLEPYRASWEDQVDPRFLSGDPRFQSQFVMLQVLIYNDRKMTPEEAPSGFEELVGDAWRDRVILRLPPPSGGMRGAFAWLIAWQAGLHGGDVEAGFAYLRALHRNTRRYAIDPPDLFNSIQRDDSKPVGIWSFTDAKFQKAEYGYPLGVRIPVEGVPVVVDCIALAKKAAGADPRRAEMARLFYEFVSSTDASEVLVKEHFRVPTRTDIPDQAKPDWLRELTFEPLPADGELASRMADEWMTWWDENIKPLDR